MVAVLNDVLFFALDTSDASTVSLCADRRLLVSVRSSPLRSVDRLRTSVRGGERFRSAVELVAHLLRDQADILVEIVRELTPRVNATEDKLIAEQVTSCRATLASLRRILIRLQRVLAPEPAALFRLLTRPPEWVGKDDVQDLRQSAEELSAAVAESGALAERVRLLQEELFALTNEQTNRTLFVLTTVTVLALPMTIISSLMGMNVGGVPFSAHGGGFWIVAAMTAAISGIGAWIAYRRHID
jgi:zinc transporter